ncbi:hypothetical protein DF044_38300 [Burkholderia contaminans]|nr:hypothetical protein DF044_38300 [Burkholderia contaminans]
MSSGTSKKPAIAGFFVFARPSRSTESRREPAPKLVHFSAHRKVRVDRIQRAIRGEFNAWATAADALAAPAPQSERPPPTARAPLLSSRPDNWGFGQLGPA